MFSCRAAWRRCGPLARTAAFRLPRDAVQRRPMSSVPGGSGENILYTVLCAGAAVASVARTAPSPQTTTGLTNASNRSRPDPRRSGSPNPGLPRVRMKKRCNAKAKVLCGRMDIRPSTGLFGCEQENKRPPHPPHPPSSPSSFPHLL